MVIGASRFNELGLVGLRVIGGSERPLTASAPALVSLALLVAVPSPRHVAESRAVVANDMNVRAKPGSHRDKRTDGHHWVLESDLEIHRKHIRLGVQENRVGKFFNEKTYPHIAVLDFGLTETQVAVVLREGLEMIAGRTRYSLRELIGTLVALRHPTFRPRQNLLAREKSCYCSAFVQHVFLKTGIDLVPGIHASHNTPEDISRTPVPHTTYLLKR